MHLKLLEDALELPPPWYVDRAGIDKESSTIALHLDFERGGTFECSSCGATGRKAYDTQLKRWRHLDLFEHRTELYAPSPRVACPACGVRQASLPWARPRIGLTIRFEEHVMRLAAEMPVRAAARLVGEHDTRLWRVVHHYSDDDEADP